MRLLLLPLALFLALPVAAQQSPCTLRLDQAPEPHGFKLGADVRAPLQRFDSIAVPEPDEYGSASVSIKFAGAAGGFEAMVSRDRFSGFRGISSVRLDALDGRISSIFITYSRDIEWISADDFIRQLNSSLLLPTPWAPIGSGVRHRQLTCEGWAIDAAVRPHGGAELWLRDLSANKILHRRIADREEQTRHSW